MQNKILYYDLETTGTDPDKHAIVQIGQIIEIDGKVEFESTLDIIPHDGAEIDPGALKVIGKTEHDLYHGDGCVHVDMAWKMIHRVWDKFIDKFNKHDKFISAGYNIRSFDSQFLRAFIKRQTPGERFSVYGSYIGHRMFDAMPYIDIATIMGKIEPVNLKLKSVCDELGITLDDAHDALADIRATRELIRRIGDTITTTDKVIIDLAQYVSQTKDDFNIVNYFNEHNITLYGSDMPAHVRKRLMDKMEGMEMVTPERGSQHTIKEIGKTIVNDVTGEAGRDVVQGIDKNKSEALPKFELSGIIHKFHKDENGAIIIDDMSVNSWDLVYLPEHIPDAKCIYEAEANIKFNFENTHHADAVKYPRADGEDNVSKFDENHQPKIKE